MKKVFISGCYDILHGGHIQFFKEARALGNHLTVCFASDKVLWEHKFAGLNAFAPTLVVAREPSPSFFID